MKTNSYTIRPKNDIGRQRRNVLPLKCVDTESNSNPNAEHNTAFELHSKHEEHYIEKELQTNETLQSLALDFNCSIAELKRVNKIHKENEIFALRVVKIPIIPGSFIIEKLQSSTRHSGQQKQTVTDNELLQNQVTDSNGTNCTRGIIPSVSIDENQKCDVLTECNNQSENYIQGDLTVLSERTNFQFGEPPVSIPESSFLWWCNGDDCGISWKPLLIFIVSLGLVGPLIYVYFFYIT